MLATYMRKVVMPTAARTTHGIPPPIWPMKEPDEMRLPSCHHLTCTCQQEGVKTWKGAHVKL